VLPGFEGAGVDPRTVRELRLEIEEFHTAYCETLDRGAVAEWPDYFTEDAVYRVTARENVEAGMPVGLVYAEGKGMLRDRAFAVANTEMFAPRYLQHFISGIRILSVAPGAIRAQTNYLLVQTLLDGPTTIHQAGRYYDVFVREAGRLLLKERQCVYDTLIIANDLVYPV
jgi:3-phenylpropionate/cinnamic acid dioxygenase small subunit